MYHIYHCLYWDWKLIWVYVLLCEKTTWIESNSLPRAKQLTHVWVIPLHMTDKYLIYATKILKILINSNLVHIWKTLKFIMLIIWLHDTVSLHLRNNYDISYSSDKIYHKHYIWLTYYTPEYTITQVYYVTYIFGC